MTFIYNTYKPKFAIAALFSYLFLVSLTVFHYHKIDLQGGNYTIENKSRTESSPFDKLIDLTHECSILQFASTVISYDHADILSNMQFSGEQDFIFNELLKQPAVPLSNGNPFRAPPSII